MIDTTVDKTGLSINLLSMSYYFSADKKEFILLEIED
jgi:hypothetical protein